jgi:hypothetical protein
VQSSFSEALAEHREAMFPQLITELLHDGYKVSFSAPGHSMFPTITANEIIMVEPIEPETVRMRDIILYRTNGQLIAHRVVGINSHTGINALPHSDLDTPPSALDPQNIFTCRGDAAAACDGPVKAGQILGRVISIERYGCRIDPYSATHKIRCLALFWMARVKRFHRTIFSIFSSNGR